MQELLGRAGQIQLLRRPFIRSPASADFVHVSFLVQAHEYGGQMSVRDRNAYALRRDIRPGRGHDDAVFHAAPDFQRFIVGFIFFACDVGDYVIHHLRPCFKILACAGNRLVCAGEHPGYAEIEQGMNRRDIALDRAVGFHCDKSALCPQPFSLRLDNGCVVVVDFRHNHRNVRRGPVCAVVGHDRAFQFGVHLFKNPNLVFFHIHRAEYKVDTVRNFFCIRARIQNRHGRDFIGQRLLHHPTARHRLAVALAGGTRACSQRADFEPWMVF